RDCQEGPKMPPPTGGPATVTPPDGEWGWAVVFGAFISIGFSYAFPKAITVFFKEIQEIFHTSYSQIAWISSIMLAVMYAGGPISSILVNKYGSRPIMMIGGFLCSIGMISASFCNSVAQLYFCVGVIGGFGLAFNLQPSLTMIGKYFFKKRPIANGLAMAGSPVFLSTLAPLNQYLFNRFGWRGSFLILETYTGLVVYAVFFGFAFGMVSSVLFETLMDIVGAQRFSSAVGLVTIIECCPVLIGPPLGGWMVDVTKDYKYMYFCCGVIVIIASIWLFIGNAINYRLLDKERKQEEEKKRAAINSSSQKEAEEALDSTPENLAVTAEQTSEDSTERETHI
ncbi:MOT2 protein, partial [Polyodon spathula]|nr:MOT2 protein [Polyodon spathula]